MRFLEQPPRYLFFPGKGGVGKPSPACATEIRLAGLGRRVLLVSTDPASNVAQVFEQPVGNRMTPVAAVAGLSALEGMTELHTLSLGNTAVSDAGLMHLRDLRNLATLVLRQTKVSRKGIAELRLNLPNTQIDL